MGQFLRVSMNRLFAALVWGAFVQTPVFADDNVSELECWNEIDPETQRGALCAIKRDLEGTWEPEVREQLRRHTELTPGEINDVVPVLFLQWAQCKHQVILQFSQRRPDIPLRLLVALESAIRISDEEVRWLNNQTGFEPHNAELDKCKEEWKAAFISYLPRSLFRDQ